MWPAEPSFRLVGFGRTENFKSSLASICSHFPLPWTKSSTPYLASNQVNLSFKLVWSRALKLTQGKVVCLGKGGICGTGRLLGAMSTIVGRHYVKGVKYGCSS